MVGVVFSILCAVILLSWLLAIFTRQKRRRHLAGLAENAAQQEIPPPYGMVLGDAPPAYPHADEGIVEEQDSDADHHSSATQWDADMGSDGWDAGAKDDMPPSFEESTGHSLTSTSV